MKNTNIKFKKISSVFLLSTLFLTLIFSCEKMPEHETDTITQEDIQAMKKDHIIELKDAVKMHDTYEKDRVKLLKDSLKKKYGANFNDTQSVWFDIKTIKAYLKYLETYASDAEGLQFYFSVYPDNGDKQKNHQTFFVAPTISNVYQGDTIQSGYTKKDGKRIFLYDAFKTRNNQASYMQKASFLKLLQDGDDDGYLFNNGVGNPPFNGN
tara:strand:+ start:494235 stop:494864 length:630 start_codon:yes stop_codon:yes gene_type:complete